jgi:hypothetical protein
LIAGHGYGIQDTIYYVKEKGGGEDDRIVLTMRRCSNFDCNS